MSKKLTFEYVEQYFSEQGCELLETKYKDNRTKMRYKCKCGDINKIVFSQFQQGRRCKKCANEKLRKDRQFSFQYIYEYFKEQGCELLETEYKNCDTKMKYKCICGNISKINFDSFKKGHRCMKCASQKRSGKNNGNYNPNLTEEERRLDRRYSGYKEWRKKVYKKDNYTCQKCKKIGKKLNAHHIKGYADNKELRTTISNGTVLCKTCHLAFHSLYGKKDNNQQQLDEYFKILFV